MGTKLEQFIRFSDHIISFVANFTEIATTDPSKYALEIIQAELKTDWEKTKQKYDECLISLQSDSEDIEVISRKFKTTFRSYVNCSSKISSLISEMTVPRSVSTHPNANCTQSNSPHVRHMSHCDTEVFQGDYLSWPTFRDLFTAIYVNNNKLSEVEKLFHLLKKTSGNAKDIVSKSPLTNEGFQLAWKNLKEAFENKRLLVNSQLKLLFDLPFLRTENETNLKNLQRGINNCLSALTIYDISTLNWDPILIFICSQRIPEATLTLWEQSLEDKSVLPTWSSLDKFLTQRCKTLESIGDIRGNNTSHKKQTTSSSPLQKKLNSYHSNISSNMKWILCLNEQHPLRNCKKFLHLSTADRFSTIKKFNCCINCLNNSHTVKKCSSQFRCLKCKAKHHTMLHRDNFSPAASILATADQSIDQTTSTLPSSKPTVLDYMSPTFNPSLSSSNTKPAASCSTPSANSSYAYHTKIQIASYLYSTSIQTCFASAKKNVLLGTAIVSICHLGITYTARALIDSASEASFISDRLRKLIKLPVSYAQTKISGLNQQVSINSSKICSFTLGSPIDLNFRVEATAFVLPQITGNLPSFSVYLNSEIPPIGIPLADVNFLKSAQVDILIGCDLYPVIMLDGVKHNILGTLLAQKTVFGWMLTGSLSTPTVSCFSTQISFCNDLSLDKQRFWEIDELLKRRLLSETDKICEQLFRNTTYRDSTGRYVVSLPFKQSFPTEIHLGASRHLAAKQFFRNEVSLLKYPSLKSTYNKVIKEYVELDHMEKISTPNYFTLRPAHCYLPHHPVIKPDSKTTKVRVVFNASFTTSNGKCLNDLLHVGPTN